MSIRSQRTEGLKVKNIQLKIVVYVPKKSNSTMSDAVTCYVFFQLDSQEIAL